MRAASRKAVPPSPSLARVLKRSHACLVDVVVVVVVAVIIVVVALVAFVASVVVGVIITIIPMPCDVARMQCNAKQSAERTKSSWLNDEQARRKKAVREWNLQEKLRREEETRAADEERAKETLRPPTRWRGERGGACVRGGVRE